MLIQETKIRTITLDAADLRQAIIMYLKARSEEIREEDIDLRPDTAGAIIIITKEIIPKQQG